MLSGKILLNVSNAIVVFNSHRIELTLRLTILAGLVDALVLFYVLINSQRITVNKRELDMIQFNPFKNRLYNSLNLRMNKKTEKD